MSVSIVIYVMIMKGQPEMNTSDWLTIIAILVAPIAAVQIQKLLEKNRERRYRKTMLFQTLMATRSARVSLDHVRALNMIDIEFHERSKIPGVSRQSKADKAVREAWRAYLDHLNTPYTEESFPNWAENNDRLFNELLHVMAISLGYDFDKVLLKRGEYFPIAHGNEELFQTMLKGNFMDIISGKKPLLIKPVVNTEDIESLEKK